LFENSDGEVVLNRISPKGGKRDLSTHIVIVFPNEDIAFHGQQENPKKYECLLQNLNAGLPEGVEQTVYEI